ncbi:MAG: hypothetical protein AABX40_02900 [Candidatus Hydrothermarchaeota archaeon]
MLPDGLNDEYGMTNLPDVWLAYVEAVNNGRMGYVVERLLSSRFNTAPLLTGLQAQGPGVPGFRQGGREWKVSNHFFLYALK